jgi:cation diffusion facilitator family transporter
VTQSRQKRLMGGVGIATSLVLLALKTWASFRSGSAALMSDAINSLLDVLTYSVAYLSMRIQDQSPDEDHPFGHRRAEPLAGLLFALAASALGAAILRDAVAGFFQPARIRRDLVSTVLIASSIVLKGGMALWYFRALKQTASPALRASYIDSRNDVLASFLALAGFELGGLADKAAAVAIGCWIIGSGVRVGLENVGFLMGKAPSPEIQEAIRREGLAVPGVLGLHDLRAHYVGDRIHVEVHIEVDRCTPLAEAHDIGVEVRRRLESLEPVQTAFVHIDPV